MSERAWRFGDVVRVDPVMHPKVPQPDDRRWMVVVPAVTRPKRQWTLCYLGGSLGRDGFLSHWSHMTGFVLVEDE